MYLGLDFFCKILFSQKVLLIPYFINYLLYVFLYLSGSTFWKIAEYNNQSLGKKWHGNTVSHQAGVWMTLQMQNSFTYLILCAFWSSGVTNSDEIASRQSNCTNFDVTKFTKENASIIVLEARGRLGNHLMAFTVLNSLQDDFKAQGYIMEDTFDLVSNYFKVNYHLYFLKQEQTLKHYFSDWWWIISTSYSTYFL